MASRWRCEFEWWAWTSVATRAGLAARVLAALREGVEPEFEFDDDALVHEVAQLMNTFQIPLPPGEQYVWSC